jgi:spore coat polysaccharide biosynthesis predicted glycosyltransferase SpsG
MAKIWFMVPARAGSKTIPKKNIRILAGKPLIVHVLESIRAISEKEQVIVSTDDEDIMEIAGDYAVIHDRSESNADDMATLDDVAFEVAEFLKIKRGASDDDIFITVQPTSPFIKSSTIQRAIEKQKLPNCESVLTVKDDRHLRWTINDGLAEPLFRERVNRQQMQPVFSETGGVITTTIGLLLKNRTRIGKKISLIEVDEREGLDIDTFSDWALAEYWMNKLRILIRVDGSRKLGFGHLYRSLAIAQNIHSHEVIFVTRSDDGYQFGHQFLSQHHYPMVNVESNEHFLELMSELKPDIVINDILDTSVEYMEKLKDFGVFVVNFEDLGEGNRYANLVINDLYPDVFPQENHWYGVEYAILNPNFEMIKPREEPNGKVDNILLAYGGTDPSNLTIKAMDAIKQIGYDGVTNIVIGPGHSNKEGVENLAKEMSGKVRIVQNVKNMAALMKKANLALTSAGRTVTELMVVGVPTIAMCQNMREMRHNHASSNFGVVNLGLGKSITSDVLAEHITMFLEDENLRRDMYNRMRASIKKRSNQAIVSKIISEFDKEINKLA